MRFCLAPHLYIRGNVLYTPFLLDVVIVLHFIYFSFFMQWITFLDSEGRVVDSNDLRKRIFYGGVVHELRKEVCNLALIGWTSAITLFRLTNSNI